MLEMSWWRWFSLEARGSIRRPCGLEARQGCSVARGEVAQCWSEAVPCGGGLAHWEARWLSGEVRWLDVRGKAAQFRRQGGSKPNKVALCWR